MKSDVADRLLIDSTEAARMCGISRTMWWSLHSAGKVPVPVRLGRRTLWRSDELCRWTAGGCPPRERWLAQEATEKRGHRPSVKNSAGNTT